MTITLYKAFIKPLKQLL